MLQKKKKKKIIQINEERDFVVEDQHREFQFQAQKILKHLFLGL